jgi:hypothetical protein
LHDERPDKLTLGTLFELARQHGWLGCDDEADVAELNKEYALVIAGERAVVLQERILAGSRSFRFLPIGTFNAWFANKTIIRGRKKINLAQRWLEHKSRRSYSDIVFAPGQDTPNAYNLWRGFAVEPRPGDCEQFLEHLRSNVCRGNEAHYRWVVGWLADLVQHPARKCGTSLVVRGKQGTGKTKVGEVIGAILGQHYTLVADPRYITGRFNSHMVDCLLLHADESFWAGDRAAEGKLKDLITGQDHLIEFKGKEPFRIRNYVRLFVTSNSDWVVPAGLEERRFAVFDIGEDRMQDREYFAAIDREMINGGREALLYFLLSYDLRSVELGVIPKTAALVEQKVSSLTSEQGWWLDVLNRGELPEGCDAASECPTKLLFEHYIKHAQASGVRRRSIETMIGTFLRKNVPGLRKKDGWYRESPGSLTPCTTYHFPALADCRAAFTKEMRIADAHWDGPEEWFMPDVQHDVF